MIIPKRRIRRKKIKEIIFLNKRVRYYCDEIDGEIWKRIPNYTNYEASDMGRIREGEFVVTVLSNGNGYLKVRMKSDSGIIKTQLIHRLVLMAHVGMSSLSVNHIDLNRSNNNLENLEYVTLKENIHHSIRCGVQWGRPGMKLDIKREIQNSYLAGVKQSDLARKYNISRQYINIIIESVRV